MGRPDALTSATASRLNSSGYFCLDTSSPQPQGLVQGVRSMGGGSVQFSSPRWHGGLTRWMVRTKRALPHYRPPPIRAMLGDVSTFRTAQYGIVLHRAFALAQRSGELCGPVHLLISMSDLDGPIGIALSSLGERRKENADDFAPAQIASCGHQVTQIQLAALELAAARGETPAPPHLLLAVLNQADAESLGVILSAGIDFEALRQTAIQMLGGPSELRLPESPASIPAGTLDRPPLPIDALDQGAWQNLLWRQNHLPLTKLRRPRDSGSLLRLESHYALREASRLHLEEDQRYSLVLHHLASVESILPDGNQTGLQQVVTGPNTQPARIPGRGPLRLRLRLFLDVTRGWHSWIGNRSIRLADRWFAVKLAPYYWRARLLDGLR